MSKMMKKIMRNVAKEPALAQATLNTALKSLQQIINEFEVSKTDFENTKEELQKHVNEMNECKKEYEKMVGVNKSTEEHLQERAKVIEAQEAHISKLEENLKQLSEENQMKQEKALEEIKLNQKKLLEERNLNKENLHKIENERDELQQKVNREKGVSKELNYESRYLEHSLREQERYCEMTKEELVVLIREKKEMEDENQKIKGLISRQDVQFQKLKVKIQWLQREVSTKQKTIQSLSVQYQEVCRNACNSENTCSQHTSTMGKENQSLKEELLHHQQRYNELNMKCQRREDKFQDKIERLECELKKMEQEDVKTPIIYQIFDNQKDAQKNTPFLKDELLNSKEEMEKSLANLSERSKLHKGLMLNMKSRNMETSEELLQAKYATNKLAVQAKNARKLNTVAIEHDERKSLLKRLQKLENENAKMSEESKEAVSDIDVCKMENTILAAKIQDHEETIRMLYKQLSDKEVRREENTKLATRIKCYDAKLKTLDDEISAKKDFQKQSRTLAEELTELTAKSEGLEKNNKSLENTIKKLNEEVEYMRKSSLKFGNTSCCMELKINLECMEKQIEQLEKTNKVLEDRVKTSTGYQEKFKWIEQTLVDRERDLSDTRNQLQTSKDKLKECECQLKSQRDGNSHPQRVFEQPNVNIHVHLDPKQLTDMAPSKVESPASSVSTDNANKNQEMYYNHQPTNVSNAQLESDLQRHRVELQLLEERNKELKKKLHHQQQNSSDSQAGDEKNRCVTNEQELHALQGANRDLEAKHDKTETEKKKLESLLEESEANISSLRESDCKLKKMVDDLEQELAGIYDQAKAKEEEHQKEAALLRKQIHSMESEDSVSLRSRIHELTNKKEKNEAVIQKLREDKGEMQMTVQRYERELQKLKDQIKEYESLSLSVTNTQNVMQPVQQQQQFVQSIITTTNNNDTKPEKSVPIWLNTSANTNKGSGSGGRSNDTQLQHKSKATSTPKKALGPIWLSSPSVGSNNNNTNPKDCVEDDSDDDFLGIRASAKKQNRSNTNNTIGNLDTSNRRNVQVRSKTNGNNNQAEPSDDSDDELLKIFGRRGPPVQKAKAVVEEHVVEVVRKTSNERVLEEFLNGKTQKKKQAATDDLDFLTLDDIPNNKSKKWTPSTAPKSSIKKPVNNAEFMI